MPFRLSWYRKWEIVTLTKQGDEAKARDLTDMERTKEAAKGIVGKRLTYRRTDEAAHD